MAGVRAVVAAGLLVVLAACAANAGTAVRGPATTPPAATTAATSTTATGTAATSTSPVGPPSCGGTINRLTTPTAAPMITVTAGADYFTANPQVEPLALAVYPDGTALSSLDVGTANRSLPGMTIGYVPQCTLDWAGQEIHQLATLDLGRPDVTDQGTTEVVYVPSSGTPIRLSAYALGIDDEHLRTGRQARARLTVLLSALRAPLAGAAPWIPDRLRVVEVPAPVETAGAALVWPGTTRLEQVLDQHQGRQRCGVLTGPDAIAVRNTLGGRSVYSRWTDAGRATGLNIGVLVPGQQGCRQS